MDDEGPAIDLLVERLATASLSSRAGDLALAAAMGEEQLWAMLEGEPITARVATSSDTVALPGLFVGDISVEGFRGIAEKARLGLRPGPGLTLVVGRNGSGKSSFAEAAELALTGTASRWEQRSKVWEEGWACLHHHGARSIELRLTADGQAGDTWVRRRWAADDPLSGGKGTAQRPGGKEVAVADLGLGPALSAWRPFLSYNELGGLLDDAPSRLYDAISAVLGLEAWVEAEERLGAARRLLETEIKGAKTEADRLRGVLGHLDDERAALALAAIPARRPWDLDAVEQLATGVVAPTTGLARLEALATLPGLDMEAVGERARELRDSAEAVAALAHTDAARAEELAELLDRAIGVHRHHDSSSCPVCGTSEVLDAGWTARTTAEVERLRGEASAVTAANRRLAQAVGSARQLLTPPPVALTAMAAGADGGDGVDVVAADAAADGAVGAVEETWGRWSSGPDDPVAMADHLEAVGPELAAAVDGLRAEAAAELARRQDLWQPVAAQLAAWLPGARTAVDGQAVVDDVKAAVKWIAEEANVVRNERFAPIAHQVQEIWETLRYDSNVDLDGVTLEGTKTRRRVGLTVSVDEVPGAALSVMSQGELHALALSLFLPRATMAASPFRFVIIDDPVQAMDTARVDGLARALHGAAGMHQVVVFTHDERLPDACRRLDLPATVLEVTRGERSQVTIRSRKSPVDNYIEDARVVLATDDYPPEAKMRVVPGLCRNALEAACVDATRRRLMAAGQRLIDIDTLIDGAGRLIPRLALALFGDVGRGGEVLTEINRKWGRSAGDCVHDLNHGSHEVIDRDPWGLVKDAERLAHGIAELR